MSPIWPGAFPGESKEVDSRGLKASDGSPDALLANTAKTAKMSHLCNEEKSV